MAEVAPDRVAIYGIENHAGTPVYVHAKTCVIDDAWATIGSDNFNRRSWTHDSELSAVVVDEAGRVRPSAAAHARRRAPRPEPTTLADCVEPAGMFAAYAETRGRARRLARRRPGRPATAGPAAPPRAAGAGPGGAGAGARCPT